VPPAPPPAPAPPAKALYAVKTSYEWVNLWRYVICQPALKHTGLAVVTFSGKRGKDIYPGLQRIMLITGHGKTATVEALKHLRWLGFLYRVSSGQGSESGEADKYMLSTPKTLDHLPMVIRKPLADPAFGDLSVGARKTAVVLNVHRRLGGHGPLTEPGVVSLANHRWWSERTTTVHLTNASDHSASKQAASRASARGHEELDDYEIIDQEVGGLDPVESSTAEGMLADDKNRRYIINTILNRRDKAA
jgi:hypothetical protein